MKKSKVSWPLLMRTEPPSLLTEEEAYRLVPHFSNTHIPATNPCHESSSTKGNDELMQEILRNNASAIVYDIAGKRVKRKRVDNSV